MHQAVKLADKVGVNGLTQAQNKAFYSDENNPVKHNAELEAFYKSLTPKEREVLPYIKQGKSTREIASILNVSQRAIMKRIQSIREKANK